MKKILKRFICVIGFLPVFVFSGIYWIFTGYSPDDFIANFLCWCTD
jgi:hypothetical protein